MPGRSSSGSSRSGGSLVETAATIVFVVPLTFYVLFVAVEASQVYGISQALQQGAREAARRLAKIYAVNPGIVSNSADQRKYGFDPVRIANVINDSSQLTAVFASSQGTPVSVTVTAVYASGKFGLAKFPDPDPLFLGPDYELKASATYTLE